MHVSKIVSSLFCLGLILLPLSHVSAQTLDQVTGLDNGQIELEFANGTKAIVPVFDTTTDNATVVKKWNASYALAIRHDGKKLALIDTQGKTRISNLSEETYSQVSIRVKTVNEQKIGIVTAKEDNQVVVALLKRDGKEVEIQDVYEMTNKHILPKNTLVKDNGRVLLRNSNKETVKKLLITSQEELWQMHDPQNCEDGWYETHAHMEESDAFEDYVQQMDEEGVACSLIFAGLEMDNLDEDYATLKDMVRTNPGRFVPFFNGDVQDVSDISIENYQTILDQDTHNLLRGLGEYAFYQEPLAGSLLTDDPWPEVFEFAAENNLIVMLHLVASQANELDTMLATYPETQVLVHGRELVTDLPSLLAEHDNLHFTLDTANMLYEKNTENPVLMFPVSGGSDDEVSDADRADEFVERYEAGENTFLNEAVVDFSPLFTATPNQVLWGTDVAFSWHTRNKVYDRLIDFSQQFMNQLSEEQQLLFQTSNAYNFFGAGVSL